MVDWELSKEAIVEAVYQNCGAKTSELWRYDETMKHLDDENLLDTMVAELIDEGKLAAITYLVSDGMELFPRQLLLPVGSLIVKMDGVKAHHD